MADPVSIAASMGISAAAGGVGAFGSLFKGAAGSAAANYQAGIARMNADIADRNANFAYQKGEAHAQTLGMEGRFKSGQAKVTQAASGIDVNTGSPVDVRRSMAEMTSLDQDRARNNAAREMYGYKVAAAGERAQAGLYEMQASASKTEGYIGAVSSILGGASSVSDKWMQGKRLGMFESRGSSEQGLYSDSQTSYT